MKLYSNLLTTTVILFSFNIVAHAEIIVAKNSTGWSVLNQTTDPVIDNPDTIPDDPDPDFNTTWYNPTVGGYTGVTYDGPAFTPGQTAPFKYGSVTGLTSATVLTNKATSYFYKVV